LRASVDVPDKDITVRSSLSREVRCRQWGHG
jgi:hypothetical protein